MLTRSDDLEILLTVVDSGGFSAAAEVLNIQVARVSRAVTKLETQLGVTLLNRTTRRVELTEEGRQFVEQIRTGLAVLQSAENDVRSHGEMPRGKLRVDAASPFIFHQLVPLIADFRHAFPDIELELSSNEGYVDLLEKRVDVAIRIGGLSDSTLHARALGRSELFMVASPEYLAKRGTPRCKSDLAQHEIIGFTSSKVLNEWPLEGDNYIAPTLKTSNGETVRQLALAGNGITCLSAFMLRDDLQTGALVAILQDHKVSGSNREQVTAVYYKSSLVAKRISAFIDFIQPRLTL